jgi:hypothetical protein
VALSSCGTQDGATNLSTIQFAPDAIKWSVGAGSGLVTVSSTARLTVKTPAGQPMTKVNVTVVPPSGSSAGTRVCAGFVDPNTCTPVAIPGAVWTTTTDDFGGVSMTFIYEVAPVDLTDASLVEAYSGTAYGIHHYSTECVDNPPITC